jgi:hypothetical protein
VVVHEPELDAVEKEAVDDMIDFFVLGCSVQICIVKLYKKITKIC